MKASTWRRILGFLILVGAAAGGTWWYTHRDAKVQYQTVPLTRGDLEATISATGTCNAVVTVQVGSQVSGNIKALYADYNTKVEKGQLVALIDPETLQARVTQAQANADNSQAAINNAKAQIARAEADIAESLANLANAKANVTRTKALMEDAKSKMARSEALFRKGVIAAEEQETAQATYRSAAATVEASEAQVDAAEHGVTSAKAGLTVAQSQLESAQAQSRQVQATLKQAQIDLQHTEIKAPVEGTVIARKMDVGQTVAASFSAPTIFEIAQDLAKMQVDTSVDEADVGRVKVDQKADFTVDAYPGTTFHGKVTQIRQAPINVQNVITYDVVVAVGNPDLKLFPGMTANVRILTDRRENVLKLPNAALRVRIDDPKLIASAGKPSDGTPTPTTGGGRSGRGGGEGRGEGRGQGGGSRRASMPVETTIYLLDDTDAPRAVKVRLGISDGTSTEIVSGDVREGQPVIIGVTSSKPATSASPMGGGSPGGGRRGLGF